VYGSSDRGWEFRDSKTCIYPYEARMRLPLQVQVGMKRPVVQEKGFDAAGLAQGFLWWPLVQEGMQMGPQ